MHEEPHVGEICWALSCLQALFELHSTIFKSYEVNWTKLVGLTHRTAGAQQVLDTHAFSDPRAANGLLSELALYFLIYTEASSLRHTPELLWFIYWCGHSLLGASELLFNLQIAH